MSPTLACVCITAGRIRHLNEAIAAFLNQSYPNKSLVIYNTLPAQHLVGDFPGVTIINPQERPCSLAIARNTAIRSIQADAYAVFDDDDGYGKDYLSTFAKYFVDGVSWVWMPQQFYLEGVKIKGVVKGSANVFAFTRKAFDAIGGYSEALSCGEDRRFVGQLTSQFNGVKIPAENFIPQFYYCWGNGVNHVSGLGEDANNRVPAWERARLRFEQQIRSKAIKTGRIELKPEARTDWDKLGADFLGKSTKPHANKSVWVGTGRTPLTIVLLLLGRLGDLINILPIAKHIAENYAKPHFMVSHKFASLLDGISYVHPYPMPFEHDTILPALKHAREKFDIVINAQPWSKDWGEPRQTDAYNKESWRQAGFLHRFADRTMLPVFDRRDLAREQALFNKLDRPGKPMLLIKLDGSISSPCPDCPTLKKPIVDRFSDNYNIIDLSTVKAERIYDLLGLFDRAAALCSIDTAFLHLAAASSVPLVALVNPKPWLGTLPRGNCIARMTYTEAVQNPARVISGIEIAVATQNQPMPAQTQSQPPVRRLIHAVERHEERPDKRKTEAWKSWDRLYSSGVIPAHLWEYPRTAKAIGDKRDLPYLKDVLLPAMNQADDVDIVFFTNDDNWLHHDLPDMLRFHVSLYGACSAQRCEFRGNQRPVETMSPEHIARIGSKHIGRDLFAATKAWWITNWDRIPDAICGASDFDFHLTCLIRLEKGVVSTRKNIEDVIHPCELPRGYIAHVWHKPAWQHPGNESQSPSQKWNRRLFREFAAKQLPTLKFDQKGRI